VDVLGTMLGVRVVSPGAASVDIVVPDVALESARAPCSCSAGRSPSTGGGIPDAGTQLHVDIPVNVTAAVSLPAPDGIQYHAAGPGDARFLGTKDGRAMFAIGSGRTNFVPIKHG
jgi:alpha-L-rhamnosidase